MGFFVDLSYMDFVGLLEARGQVDLEDCPVIADDDVASAKLPDDPGDADALKNGIEVAAVEASVEKLRGVETDGREHLLQGASEEVVEIAVLRKCGGVVPLPQEEVTMVVVNGFYLESRETGDEAFFRIAGIANDAEIAEFLAVTFDDVRWIHGDEGHAAVSRRYHFKPGISHLFGLNFRVGEIVVERPRLSRNEILLRNARTMSRTLQLSVLQTPTTQSETRLVSSGCISSFLAIFWVYLCICLTVVAIKPSFRSFNRDRFFYTLRMLVGRKASQFFGLFVSRSGRS
jgi:hypothetical protein